MTVHDFDLAVIGAGPAGEKGAAQAAYFGKRVVVIEKEADPGGAAVHTGTLPSKTLREAALFFSGHRQRALYGVDVTVAPGVTVQRMVARKDAVRDAETRRIRENLARHGVALLTGTARISGPHELAVQTPDGGSIITAGHILVATGSRPSHPAGVDFAHPRIDDSDSILRLEGLPSRLVIVGGGVIGCEYACLFAELGTRVVLVDGRDRLLPFLDRDLSADLATAMARLGVDVRSEARVGLPQIVGDSIEIALDPGANVQADHVLYATGRAGATAGLGLEELGVALDRRRHVVVDAVYRTAVPSILAAGDVIGFPALASTSMEQARVAVCHAFGFPYKQQVADLLPYGIYTIPEVSSVGLSEEAAREAGIAIVCGRADFAANARAQIRGAEAGWIKLVFERSSRRLRGVHILGSEATELIHIGQAVIGLGGTVETLIDMVFNYPTLSEAYKYAAYDALGHWPSGAG